MITAEQTQTVDVPVRLDDITGPPPAALNVRCLHRNARNLFKARCAEVGLSMEQAMKQLVEKIGFRELDLRELGIRSH